MKKKIDRDEYVNLDQFENDFGLIVKNCHFFNEAKCKFEKIESFSQLTFFTILDETNREL